MAIKKFTVMASNAGGGKYISAATFADTLKTAKKKYNEKFKKGPYACAEVNDLGYIYYKTDDGRVFVPNVERTYDFALSQVKKFNAEGTNIKSACAAIKAECGKKSVKSGRLFLFPWEVEGEFADGYRYTAKGNSEAECVEKLGDMQDKHGELVWYSGTTDEYYDAGRLIDSACTKKSVKSSKGLTVPKSKRKPVKASSDGWKETDYSVFMDGGRQVMSKYTKEYDGYKIMILPEYNHKTDILSWVVFLFDVEEEPRRLESFETAYDAKDFADYEVYEGYVKPVNSSKSVKKFGVKASKAAKKRVANKKITANSDSYYNEDIVFYFNGKKQFEGSIFDLAVTVEILCHDPKVMQVFQDYCNQFGDSFDFDGTPRDTALVFTKLVMFEAEGANEPSDFYVEYSDYRKHGSFEIFYANDGIYSAKSINAGINAPSSDGPLCVCENCKAEIESREGRQIVYDVISDLDIEPDEKLICDWCEEESTELYQISPDEVEGAKSIKCWDNGNDVWEYQESYDNYYDEEPPEHIAKELERLAKLTDKYTDRWFEKFEELHPGERFSIVYPFPDVDEAVGYTLDDAEYRPDEIKSSTDIKADTWESSEENINDMLNDSYEYDGFEDSDMLEYVDSFLQDASSGAWLSTDHVVYNGPDDWEVSAGLSPEAVESDFWFFLDDVDHELYEDMLEADLANPLDEDPINYTYNQNAINGNEFYIQLYPNNNQVSAPQIDFDEEYLTSEWLDRLVEIRKQYEESRIAAYTEFQDGLGEFLANGITASTDIKAANSLNLNAKPNYTDWMLRGYKFDGEDVTTIRIDFQDDVRKAVMDMFSDPDIETVDLYKIPTEQDTTGVFEDEEYFGTFTRDDIKSSTEVSADLQLSRDKWDRKKYNWSDNKNSITDIDGYVKDLADGVVERFPNLTYDISDEAITFTDEDGTVVYIQPIDEIVPEKEDLENDILELGDALQNEFSAADWNKQAEEEFDAHYEDDPDYATRAIQLSEDIGEVDIDDLDPIIGDTSAEDRIFDVIVDKLRTSELAEFGEVDILSGDADIKVYPDGADIDYIIAFVADPITINFEDRFMKYEKYPDYNMLNHTQHINGLTTEIIVHNGTIGAVNYVDLDGYGLSNYDISAYEKYVEQLARPVVEEIYNFVDQAVYDGNITSSTAVTADVDDDLPDMGYGFDSNGEAIDESTVEELYRIAEYEILPKSELAKIDEYVSIDEDSWDFYMSSPHVTEKFYIHFKLTEKDIDFNKYALPEAAAFPDFNYYTAVLDFDIYTENGEVTSVILEDKEIYRPDGAFDDYDVKKFDKLYNVDAIINYVEKLAADTVKDIYNGTTNL